jgi:hypothetical protein
MISLTGKKGWVITMNGEAFNSAHVDSVSTLEGFFGSGQVMAQTDGKEGFELCFGLIPECLLFMEDLEKAIKKKKVISGQIEGLDIRELTSFEIFSSPSGGHNVRAIGKEEDDGTRVEKIVFEGTHDECRAFIKKTVGKP